MAWHVVPTGHVPMRPLVRFPALSGLKGEGAAYT